MLNASELADLEGKGLEILDKKEQDNIKEYQLNLLSLTLKVPGISQSTTAILHFDRLGRNLIFQAGLI